MMRYRLDECSESHMVLDRDGDWVRYEDIEDEVFGATERFFDEVLAVLPVDLRTIVRRWRREG